MTKWLIERAGVRLTVCAKSNSAAELVEVALAGMRPTLVNRVYGIKLSVGGDQNEWQLHDHASEIRRKLISSGDLIYHLTDRIVFHIADKVSAQHCLHAAAVSYGDGALLIPAVSGAGKSSFTTWLVANGFAYISDELILIDDDRRIDGLGRPIQIKAHGLAAIKPLLKSPLAIYPGKLANAVPISSLGGELSEPGAHRLALILFPQYQKGAEYTLLKLSSANAGMRLMANHVNARNLQGHGFRAMMQMIRTTPCYALDYGGYDTLPDDFAAQIKELLCPIK